MDKVKLVLIGAFLLLPGSGLALMALGVLTLNVQRRAEQRRNQLILAAFAQLSKEEQLEHVLGSNWREEVKSDIDLSDRGLM
jgi:hypothetical protein